MGRRHLVKAVHDGLPYSDAWAELEALRKDLYKFPRDATVDAETWQRCRAVGNATGNQAPKAWWNFKRWGGHLPG